MSYEYSNNEYTEMVRVLAKSHDNVARACHEFGRLFPNLPAPSRELMLEATQRLRDHGQFQSSSSEMVSEEDEEGQESEGGGEEGDDEEGDDEEERDEEGGDEEGGDEEGEDEEGNEEEGEEEKEEEKEEMPKPKPWKEPLVLPVLLPAGKGFPLGHISNVAESLSRFKTQDQKILHQYLFGHLCPDRDVIVNIKNFKGFQWTFNSTEYKAKLMETARLEPRHLRAMCEMLDLQNNGGPSELAKRLLGFLQQPGTTFQVSQRPPIKADNRGADFVLVPRRTRSHSPPSVAIFRDEDDESDPATKANDSKDGSEDSDGSTKSSGSEASDAGSEGEDVIGTECREAEAKVIPDRQRPTPKNKKNARDMLVRSTKGEKASSEESYEGEESSEEEEEGSDEEESGDESDTPAEKKTKRPPTDEEIKKYVRQVLEGANLEHITMKTLCKQVFSHYPDYDLEHKKEFIKSAVKSVITVAIKMDLQFLDMLLGVLQELPACEVKDLTSLGLIYLNKLSDEFDAEDAQNNQAII